MNLVDKIVVTAAVVLMCALALMIPMIGLHLAGWLTLWLLHLQGDVNLDIITFLQYYGARHLPQFAPYATRIVIAGCLGFGLPVLLWLGLLVPMYWYIIAPLRQGAREAAFAAARASRREAPTIAEQTERYYRTGAKLRTRAERPGDGPENEPAIERKPALPASGRVGGGRGLSRENEDMDIRQAAATLAAAVSAAALGGCGQDYSGVRFQQNPHPVEEYEITIKVDNAPGPFKKTGGSADFQIANNWCAPPGNRFVGAQTSPDQGGVDMDLQPTGPNTWTATVYADAMLEAPYFGRDICKWDFIGFTALLMATGTDGERPYGPDIDGDDIRNQKTVVRYFSVKSYPGSGVPRPWVDSGVYDRSSLPATVTDADLFTVTLSARKVRP